MDTQPTKKRGRPKPDQGKRAAAELLLSIDAALRAVDRVRQARRKLKRLSSQEAAS